VSDIIAFAPFQLTSSHFLKMQTHSQTHMTSWLGLAKERISVMSSFFRFCSASAASCSAGIAEARPSSASAFWMAILSVRTASSSSLVLATSCLATASSVLALILLSISSHSADFACTTTVFSASSFCIFDTSSAAWMSLERPPSRRCVISELSLRLLPSCVL